MKRIFNTVAVLLICGAMLSTRSQQFRPKHSSAHHNAGHPTGKHGPSVDNPIHKALNTPTAYKADTAHQAHTTEQTYAAQPPEPA